MSGWSRTDKPDADKTIPAGEIFGVDSDEMTETPGPAHAGWVRRREIGSTGRVVYETLVAMKNPPVEDSGDDTEFPGGITTTAATTTAAATTTVPATTTVAPTTTVAATTTTP
jgi:hypothetical protein